MKESKRKNLSVPEFKKLKEKHIEKSFNECYQAIKKLKAHVEHRDFMAQLKFEIVSR